jgi:tetratricopeptide (TPR) repeat protein
MKSAKFKNIFVLCFFLSVCFTPFLYADDLQKAQEFYREGDFEQASVLYLSVEKKYLQNPYYHYNLGNCYYKMDKIGKAVASFYRAFYLLPRNEDIRKNLSLALHSSGETLVAGGLPLVLHKLYFYFSFSELKGFFWLSLWVWVVSMILYFGFSKGHKFLKPVVMVVSVFVLCIGLWLTVRYSTKADLAVVSEPSVAVRSGPSESFAALALLGEGKLLVVGSLKDDWYEVEVKGQAIKGWVKKDLLEVI